MTVCRCTRSFMRAWEVQGTPAAWPLRSQDLVPRKPRDFEAPRKESLDSAAVTCIRPYTGLIILRSI
jgi:hypothetical protein